MLRVMTKPLFHGCTVLTNIRIYCAIIYHLRVDVICAS